MAKSIGIFVTNPDNFRHVMGITKAAKAKGSAVKVFFSWDATHNAKKNRISLSSARLLTMSPSV